MFNNSFLLPEERGEDVDWINATVSFTRQKSCVPVLVHLGAEALNVFKDLPSESPKPEEPEM